MKIQLLGTSAAEGIPAFFCGCRVCENARKVGGKEVRTRSSALIDGVLKVDFGPDSLAQIHRYNLDARDWLGIVFTHSHDDHFLLTQFQYLVYPFNKETEFPFPLFGCDGLTAKLRNEYQDWPVEIHTTHSFVPYQVCDYQVTPIRANHMLEEDAQNLIIERDGKSLLYATDTGIWCDETWKFLEGRALDCLIVECTEGRAKTDYWGHLSLDECIAVVARLRESGALKPGAQVITTHHSHLGTLTYSELSELLAPHDIVAGYDGLEIEV